MEHINIFQKIETLEKRVAELERMLKTSVPEVIKSSKFVPPAKEDVEDYFMEREPTATLENASIFAEKFIAHYTNTDWRYGKGGRKMKCWKSAMISSWKTSEFVKTNQITMRNGKFDSSEALRVYQESLNL
jgi:hypothetical protein